MAHQLTTAVENRYSSRVGSKPKGPLLPYQFSDSPVAVVPKLWQVSKGS